MIIKVRNRLLAELEFFFVVILGIVCGISYVIRYLKNPNPQTTVKVLRAFGATVGEKTTFKGSVILDNVYEDKNSSGDFSHINVGKNCYIGDNIYFDLADQIVIEDNVVVSGKVSLITHADCNRSPYLAKKFPRQCKSLILKEGSWIGFGATILCGITIGSNAVIGASSLVRDDVNDKVVFVGVPAQEVKKI